MNRFIFTLLFAVTCCACKKTNTLEPVINMPGTKISYKVLNTSIDFLQYNNPLKLDLNHDSQVDYILTSVLLEENDLPYLYLLVNKKSPNLNRFVVNTEKELVNGGFWAEPLEKQSPISSNLTAGNQWSPDLSKACFISVSDNGSSTIFDGKWLGKRDKYLGLKFLINGQYHYGWLRISHTAGESRIAILDYGYNEEAGKGILAGER